MISTQGLAGLRIGATLVHGIPGLRMSVRGGDGEVMASVGWPVSSAANSGSTHPSGSGAAGMGLTPCEFRKAVTRAHALHEQGRRMTFLDLAPGCDPDLEILLPPRGAMFAGGIYRVPLDGRWLFAFGTTLPAAMCRRIAADLVDEALPLDMLAALGIRPDDDTGVSIVYAETAVRVAPHRSRSGASTVADDEGRVIDLLQAMLARFAAQELIRDVQRASVNHG